MAYQHPKLTLLLKLKNHQPRKFLSRLKDAGLQSLPGAGAEILTDNVKEIYQSKKNYE